MEPHHHAPSLTPPPDLQADSQGGNLDFWPELLRRRTLMTLLEVTEGDGERMPCTARFSCRRCGASTGWLPFRTPAQAKQPRPCANCNAPETQP